jgi:hypothetical protein
MWVDLGDRRGRAPETKKKKEKKLMARDFCFLIKKRELHAQI